MRPKKRFKASQFIDLIESRLTLYNIFESPPKKRQAPASDAYTFEQRYNIERKLGQGASGTVYLVWDQYIKRYVATKLSKMNADRFMAEAQSAGRLKHANIVSIHDASTNGDFCYLTMEYIAGPDLGKFCDKDHLLPLKRALKIIISICEALNYAHKNGVIHKDIKPTNILLDQENIPKLTDFGITQMVESTLKFGIFGTPSYMSPEQLKNEVITKKSDIFSLGCVLYELVTGQKAFEGDNFFSTIYKVIYEEPTSISSIRQDIPPILEKIIKKALSKEPEKRYQTCLDFAHDLGIAIPDLNSSGSGNKVKGLINYVQNLPFFQKFTESQVKELISGCNIIKVPQDKIILAEGDIGDAFYVILRGIVKVATNSKDIATIKAGECFGEMGCIGGQVRMANIVSVTDCILMRIKIIQIDELSDLIQLQFYKSFSTTLCRRLSKSSSKTSRVMKKSGFVKAH